MSFAKLAADDLMSDDAQTERTEKRQKWLQLLGTLGIGAGAVGGAYYLAKNHGEHFNQATDAVSKAFGGQIRKPDPPTSNAQNMLDHVADTFHLPTGYVGPRTLGTTISAFAGAAIPGAGIPGTGTASGNTVNKIVGATSDSRIGKEVASWRPTDPGFKGKGMANLLTESAGAPQATPGTPGLPAIPGVNGILATKGVPATRGAPAETPLMSDVAAVGRGSSTPVPINPDSTRDLAAMRRGLALIQKAGPSHPLHARVMAETGMTPGNAAAKLKSVYGMGEASPRLRGFTGLLSGLAGNAVGGYFDKHMGNPGDVSVKSPEELYGVGLPGGGHPFSVSPVVEPAETPDQ